MHTIHIHTQDRRIVTRLHLDCSSFFIMPISPSDFTKRRGMCPYSTSSIFFLSGSGLLLQQWPGMCYFYIPGMVGMVSDSLFFFESGSRLNILTSRAINPLLILLVKISLRLFSLFLTLHASCNEKNLLMYTNVLSHY